LFSALAVNEIDTANELLTTTTTATTQYTHTALYDVDQLMGNLDCDKSLANYASTRMTNENRMNNQASVDISIERDEMSSPRKRCLSIINGDNEHDDQEQISPKKSSMSVAPTLGDRLQKAANVFSLKGLLPFDDDYIELARHLFHNSILSDLEKVHLKSLLLNQ
jgi:hypothetical protein